MGRILHTSLSIALLGVAACATGPGVAATWVDAEGRSPEPGAIASARDACYAEVDAELPRSSRRFEHIRWGHAMRGCMERRGFVLVEAPPAETD